MKSAYIIFGDSFTFPEGEAATNRVHTYAKGLLENGIAVHVICFANYYNTIARGTTNNIHYYHPFGNSKRSKYLFVRTWQKFIKLFRTIKIIREIRRESSIIGINCWTQRILTQSFIFLIGFFFRINIFLERSEHTLRNYQGSFLRKMQGNIKTWMETKFCNGIFCISEYLMNFYLSKGMSVKKLLLLPSTVDPERFIHTSVKPFSFRYIGYFGSLTIERDNIDVLLKAFAVCSKTHDEVFLVIGGFCTELEKRQIEDLIEELNITSRVVLLKYLARQEVINYMVHSDILVLVRRLNLQTQASFPSKLTEYLATSKPVVTVNVGEIPNYLTNGVNCYMIEPENHTILAEILDYVLDNYEEAMLVGKKGRELTNTIFNYRFQAKRIVDFSLSLAKTLS